MSDAGMFRSLHSRPFMDGHTMQFMPSHLLLHNSACILGCSYCYHGLLLYFLEVIIFMSVITLLNLSVTHNLSFHHDKISCNL